MALPVGIQIYSVRTDAAADLRGTLEKLKALGYDGVEFAGLYGNSPADIRNMCNEIGLVPISAHVPLAELVADAQKTIASYAEIGCKYIAVPYLPAELRPGTDGFAPTIDNIRSIAKAAKAAGIQLLYHNHDFEFVKLDGEYALDMLYRIVDAELLKTELDTCWVKVAGEDPVRYIGKYTGRAPVVHLKDFAGSRSEDMYELIGMEKKAGNRGTFEFRPVGYGVQDFWNILAASQAAGAQWVIVEQDSPSMGKTPLECAEMSRRWLSTIGW